LGNKENENIWTAGDFPCVVKLNFFWKITGLPWENQFLQVEERFGSAKIIETSLPNPRV
jgi:hypothetical protein